MPSDWTWERLQQAVALTTLRRAVDHLAGDRVDLLDPDPPHLAGRVGGFDASVDARTGEGQCSCGLPGLCPHQAALLASGLGPAPARVRDAPRHAFGPTDPPAPVPAFPDGADLEVPADALSPAQRAAVEAVPGVVRKSATAYTLPRDQSPRLAGSLEGLGTGLVVFPRRPYVRLRASVQSGGRVVRLVSMEAPGMTVRSALERHGYAPLRKPKSLVHEYEGPRERLHELAEEVGLRGVAVILPEGQPPSFEPLLAPVKTPRAPIMPVLVSRRRFDWWTPRLGLTPLQLAILQRHGSPVDDGVRVSSEALRSVEREFVAAGLHLARVEDAPPLLATAEAGTVEGAAVVRVKGRLLPAPVLQAFHQQGYAQSAGGGERLETVLEGPAANLPALAVSLAQSGVHLTAGRDGWPPLPEPVAPPSAPSRVLAEDPRLPLAREGQLVERGDHVALAFAAGHVLPRSLRIELYRMGWFREDGTVQADPDDAGRLVGTLREGGFDVKWPKPRASDWRLATVRYQERPRREGGGTLLHLKGPIPLGRLGGADPAAEQARIQAIVKGMEDTLKEMHPEARALAHGALPGVWVVDRGAGRFLLHAAAMGASVTVAPALNPIPLGRGVVLVDQSCLPPRLVEYRRATMEDSDKPVISPEIQSVLARVVPEGLEVDRQRGHYLVPSTRMAELVEALRELGCKVLQRRLAPRGQRYQRWEPALPEDETGARPKLREAYRGRFDGDVPGLRRTTKLDPHQREALAFILHHQHSCLLADEMGLGKTLTAIASAQFLPGRVLVVCPASARDVWKQEVHGWTHERARVLQPSEAPDVDLGDAKYVVVAYSGLSKFADRLATEAFDLVILDESHYVKSRAAQRTRLVQEKLARIPRRLILSGTPVMNEPQEVRTQLAFVHPEEWSDTAWFNRRFQQPWKHGTPEVKEAVLKRLRQYLEGVMLRREKRQALPDLPEKKLHVHRLQLPPAARRAYDEAEDEFRDYMHEHDEDALTSGMATTAGRLERLKQTALVGKLPLIVEQVRGILDKGEKVVLFSHYREPIRSLAKELDAYGVVTLTGSTKPEERGPLVQRFQKAKDVRVFVGQTLAAGVAVTLTAARHAVFCDLEWNPALHRQAMDRVHRKTQTRDVEVHFFLAEDTVEEDIAEVLEEKTEMMDQLLEGRAGTGFGLRDKEAAQREVALRILSRRRRAMAGADEDD